MTKLKLEISLGNCMNASLKDRLDRRRWRYAEPRKARGEQVLMRTAMRAACRRLCLGHYQRWRKSEPCRKSGRNLKSRCCL